MSPPFGSSVDFHKPNDEERFKDSAKARVKEFQKIVGLPKENPCRGVANVQCLRAGIGKVESGRLQGPSKRRESDRIARFGPNEELRSGSRGA
jgi:hypothetical protein